MIFQTEKTSFQAIKTTSSKSRKIHLFPKGLTNGFGPKMAIFLSFFFQAIQARKMSFMIFQNKKTPFQATKTCILKSRKIDFFPKGVTNGFGPQITIFPTFFFQAIQARKMSFIIFYNEKTPFQNIKTTRSNSPKIDIFPKGLTDGFGPKMEIFPTCFSTQYIQARKMSFMIFWKVKTRFQAIKTRSSKSRKSDIFSKELTHCFGPKMEIFPTNFFQAIQARKMSFMIFQNEKTPFQAIKTRSLKSQKIDIFRSGLTHGFGSKMAIFSIFFFQAIQARKMSFMILQHEKMPFYAIKKEVETDQKLTFLQKVFNPWFG